jgi:hypothetical protein
MHVYGVAEAIGIEGSLGQLFETRGDTHVCIQPSVHIFENKSKSVTTPHPRRATASAPPEKRKDPRGGGNAQQYGARAATREDEATANQASGKQQTRIQQQARLHQQRKPHAKGHQRAHQIIKLNEGHSRCHGNHCKVL